jgi:hypothetical protein
VANFFSGAFDRIAGSFGKLRAGRRKNSRGEGGKPDEGGEGQKKRLSPAAKRAALVGGAAAGLVVIVALALVVVFQVAGKKAEARARIDAAQAFVFEKIDRADIFLPPEPDSLPKFLPPREKRDFWPPEVRDSFWVSPLELTGETGETGEKFWREKLRDTIDGFLERVP